MAAIDWEFPVKGAHGKFAKSHMVQFQKRSRDNNNEVKKQYTSCPERAPYSPSVAQQQHAHRFGLIGKKVAQYRQSANFADMQAAFRAQSQYHTLTAYLWHTAAAEVDNEG